MSIELCFTALGTPWNITIDGDFDDMWRRSAMRLVQDRLERFERVYSRFRPDSLVSHIKTEVGADDCDHDMGQPLGGVNGGNGADANGQNDARDARTGHGDELVSFPDDSAGLFALCDRLFEASEGRIDPCAGADLEALGYGRDLVFDCDIAPAARHHQENDRKERDQQKHGQRPATNITAISIAEGTWATLGAAHHPTWGALRKGAGPCELRIPAGHVRPALDFGACGKGYAVDLAAQVLERMGARNYVIDASGDLRIRGGEVADGGTGDAGGCGSDDGAHSSDGRPRDAGINDGNNGRDGNDGRDGAHRSLRIAMEDPTDPTMAVGVATVRSGSLCASGVGRRHWRDSTSGAELHHILDAVSGTPTRGTLASWTFVPYAPNVTAAPIAATGDGTSDDATDEGALLARDFPTAVADGLATALFSCDPARLRAYFPYDFMLMHDDRSVQGSAGFPAQLFRG